MQLGLAKQLSETSAVTSNLGLRGASIKQTIRLTPSVEQWYLENMDLIDVRLGYTYSYKMSGNYSVELLGSFGASYMYQNQVNIALRNLEERNLTEISKNGMNQRHLLQPHLLLGGNIARKLAEGKLSFGIQYLHNFRTTMDRDQIYNDLDFNLNAHYINDLLRLNSVLFSLTYSAPFNYKVTLN